ncbi:MAG: hypothetical protein KDA60_17515, partial [Planctomycetales bacterium]|nr:hypothetical protein [Planctomycetales bacterium]
MEQRFPQLQDRLSSSIAFLDQDESDDTAGSVSLRRAVVARAQTEVASYPIDETLTRRPTRDAAVLLAVLLLTIGGLGLASPDNTWRSVQRLLLPWGDLEWPRRQNLQFTSPAAGTAIAIGADIEFRVVDQNDRLPDYVELWVRPAESNSDGARWYEMKYRGGAMTHQLRGIRESIDFCAIGGDDDRRQWQRLAVVEPPQVAAVEYRLTPPSYTGWVESSATGNLRVLDGTQITVKGRATQDVTAVELVTDDASGLHRRAMSIVGDHRVFLTDPEGVAWVANSSGTFYWELRGAQEVYRPDHIDHRMDVVPDRPPIALFRQEPIRQMVTTGTVAINIVAKDDLAVQQVLLRFSVPSDPQGSPHERVLFQGPEAMPEIEAVVGEMAEDIHSIDLDLSLFEVPEIMPGRELVASVVVADYKGQETETAPIHVAIVDEKRFIDRLAQRQLSLLEQIEELLNRLRDVKERTTGMRQAADEILASAIVDGGSPDNMPEVWGRPQVDQLQAIQLNQRDIQDRLTRGEESVLRHVKLLSEEFAQSRLPRIDMSERFRQVEDLLSRLDEEEFEPGQRELVTALKEATPHDALATRDGMTPIRDHLAVAEEHQETIIKQLEQLLDRQTIWNNSRRFARELGQLIQAQDELARKTRSLRMQALDDLAAADVTAELRLLAQQQSEVARQFSRLRTRIEETVDELAATDPAGAQLLRRVAEIARREAIDGRMREASQTLRLGRLGNAEGQHQEISRALDEIADALNDVGPGQLATFRERMEDMEQQLATARERHDVIESLVRALVDAEVAAAEKLQELSRLRDRLMEQLQALEAELQSLSAPMVRDELQQARTRMRQAGLHQETSELDQALAAEEDAGELLNSAARSLAAQSMRLQQQIERHERARLAAVVSGLLAEQVRLTEEASRLQTATDPDRDVRLAKVEEDQDRLGADTRAQADSVVSMAVFQVTLEVASQKMIAAAQALRRRDLAGAEIWQNAATEKLQQILVALRDEKASQPDSSQT